MLEDNGWFTLNEATDNRAGGAHFEQSPRRRNP
jgi:hypothetical protein